MHFAPLPYLDPGSGSFIIQILIASLLGIGVALRVSWSRIKKWLGKQKDTETEEADEDDTGDNA